MYLHTYDAYIAHSFKISTDHTLVLSEIKMYNNIHLNRHIDIHYCSKVWIKELIGIYFYLASTHLLDQK